VKEEKTEGKIKQQSIEQPNSTVETLVKPAKTEVINENV
jgi:hypothetical protein